VGGWNHKVQEKNFRSLINSGEFVLEIGCGDGRFTSILAEFSGTRKDLYLSRCLWVFTTVLFH
jgi:ubiquinone/menaquinone biosynthesis C-methylase UbiE